MYQRGNRDQQCQCDDAKEQPGVPPSHFINEPLDHDRDEEWPQAVARAGPRNGHGPPPDKPLRDDGHGKDDGKPREASNDTKDKDVLPDEVHLTHVDESEPEGQRTKEIEYARAALGITHWAKERA
jgi:hypothetical protein